uniref:Uncharacterized protein n=1 Tax=Oryza barthii TaxID=65489 RepID=A0A0D3HBG1_9ORYZ
MVSQRVGQVLISAALGVDKLPSTIYEFADTSRLVPSTSSRTLTRLPSLTRSDFTSCRHFP